jgi:hypothetical protein
LSFVRCESAQGLDADRRDKLLKSQWRMGSPCGAVSHLGRAGVNIGSVFTGRERHRPPYIPAVIGSPKRAIMAPQTVCKCISKARGLSCSTFCLFKALEARVLTSKTKLWPKRPMLTNLSQKRSLRIRPPFRQQCAPNQTLRWS